MTQKTLQILIGENIRKILEEKGMKQQELVERSGLTKSYISLVLSGKINVTAETIGILERALGETILKIPSKYSQNNAVGILNHVPYDGHDCIYFQTCNGELGNKGEHIFNSAWGWGAQENDIICPECNGDFSSTIDTSFGPFIQRIKNVKSLVTGRQKNPPRVDLPDGRVLGKHAQLKTSGATHIDTFEAGIDDDFDYDLTLQYRSTAHTCLKALAYFTPKLARDSIFDKVKTFIKNGPDDLKAFAIETDVNGIFLPTKGQFLRKDFNHVILYFSKRLNKVVGVFHLLGVIKRSVILSKEWYGDEMVIIVDEHVGNEIRGRVWELRYIDENMPSIIDIQQLSDEVTFKEDEKYKFKQWRASTDLSTRLTRYIGELANTESVLSEPELMQIKKQALDVWSAILYRTENDVSDSELAIAAERFGLNSLLEESIGKHMSIGFAQTLTSIGEKTLTSFDKKLFNLE